jgi:hypothetical protein
MELVDLEVLVETFRRESELGSKATDLTLLGDLDLIPLQWLLALTLGLSIFTTRQLLMVIRPEVGHKGVKVVQVTQTFGVAEFILIDAHVFVEHGDLLEEVLDLLLVSLELAILLIVVENDPDGVLVEFFSPLVLAVLGDSRHIFEFLPQKFKNFLDLLD